jgi:hypothetical protein
LFSPKIFSFSFLLCSKVYLVQKYSGLFTNIANLEPFKCMQFLLQTNPFCLKIEKGKNCLNKKGKGREESTGPGQEAAQAQQAPPPPRRIVTAAAALIR